MPRKRKFCRVVYYCNGCKTYIPIKQVQEGSIGTPYHFRVCAKCGSPVHSDVVSEEELKRRKKDVKV